MRNVTPACRRLMGARAESLQERLFCVVLLDVLGWGLSRGILGRCLKDGATNKDLDALRRRAKDRL